MKNPIYFLISIATALVLSFAIANYALGYTCSSGGPGSASCSTGVNGGGGNISGGTSCSVECRVGYYACCNAYHNKCQCRLDKPSLPVE
jgi:hypothetical protein